MVFLFSLNSLKADQIEPQLQDLGLFPRSTEGRGTKGRARRPLLSAAHPSTYERTGDRPSHSSTPMLPSRMLTQ